MTAGTKVFLAVFALVVGVLVLYYGMLMPEGDPLLEAPVAELDAGADGSIQPNAAADALVPREPLADQFSSLADGPTPGLLGETVREAVGNGAGSGAGRWADPASDPAAAALADSGSTAAPPDPPEAWPRPLANVSGVAETPQPGPDPALFDAPADADGRVVANQPVELSGGGGGGGAPAELLLGRDANTFALPPTSEYTVQEGDTMVSIAEEWFGAQSRWTLIAKANPRVDPNRMQIGQKLRLPPRTAAADPVPPEGPAPSAALPPPVVAVGGYVVKAGDTLSSIARRLYSDPALWELLYKANRVTIGPNPGALKIGMKLTLPDNPAKRGG